MADTAIRAPRSQTEAVRLCEQWAALDGEIAAIEQARDAAIAAANAEVDKDLLPLVARRAAIAAKLEPWWKANAAALTQGKRKSAELGGAVLGTRTGKVTLVVAGDEKELAAKMALSPWSKALLRVTVALDKPAMLEALSGKRGEALAQLGVSRSTPSETFYIERTRQAATPAKLAR